MDINTCLATTAEVRTLALYSHIIPALATMILGLFVLANAQSRLKANAFFLFTATFSIWLIADLINWNTNSYALLAATWAPLDYINIVFFLLLFYFVYIDLHPTPMHPGLGWLLLIAGAAPFFITASGNAVSEFIQPVCEMGNNEFLTTYKLGLELTILAATLLLSIARMWTVWTSDPEERTRVALIGGSIFLFMGIFALAEYESVQTEVYEIMLYSLFSLPIFILVLTLVITNYQTFRLGGAAIKILFYVFLALAGTQFFFAGDITEFLLASMSFFVVVALGLMLFRSNEREIQFRQQLEMANRQQESLLHFISHEVKGFLTKNQAGFASIVEGDFGDVSQPLRTMAQAALADTRKGVTTVMDILSASDLQKGTVEFKKEPFDFKKLVEDAVSDFTPTLKEKGLSLQTLLGEGDFTCNGDKQKISRHVIRNLIDNSIKYTPQGSITIALKRQNGSLRFSIEDTGVGITPDDIRHLFTEGGKGKDSLKVNVDSTGFGLFIAKQITEAHGGSIRAESKGMGQGSTFVVELPIV